MAVKHSKSYIAVPPGKVIREVMDNRGISFDELVQYLEVSDTFIYDLLEGDVELTAEIANKLELLFDVPASFWMNYEKIYREKLEKVNAENKTLIMEPA